MRKPIAGVNPRVLQWARERTGCSVEDVARVLRKEVEVIVRWEAGEDAPTYVDLEKLAYTVYKRPLALFFFPAPPSEEDATQDFRTLPDFEIDNLSSHTRYILRQAQAMQLALKELNDGQNPAKSLLFSEFRVAPTDAPRKLAERLRGSLEVSLATQESWESAEEALKEWRNRIEDRGIFIFKESFKQRDVSGFCLMDDIFPIIYLNNSTASSRQIFTIFHELAHILLHTSGVTKRDDRFIDSLRGSARQIEIFANRFAAEFLVPSSDVERRLSPDWNDTMIARLADKYHVSREVILRVLLNRELVSSAEYREKAAAWAEEHEQARSAKKGGGHYYNTRSTYLGHKYLQLAFNKYYQGRISAEQLADYVGVKVRNLDRLEEVALRGSAAE